MKKFLSALCATALTASVAVTGALPASAAPVFVPMAPTAEHSDVIKVQDFRWKKRRNWNGPGFENRQFNRKIRRSNNWNGNWNNDWDGSQNWKKYNGPKYGWYNGYKGYPYQRRNYRYHNGYGLWFPAGAFIAGAIIGGAIANNNGYYRGGGGSAHVEWCYDRYRSYRAWDNTFQPYNGPRRQCYSPYS
jgi:hypothetical protein